MQQLFLPHLCRRSSGPIKNAAQASIATRRQHKLAPNQDMPLYARLVPQPHSSEMSIRVGGGGLEAREVLPLEGLNFPYSIAKVKIVRRLRKTNISTGP